MTKIILTVLSLMLCATDAAFAQKQSGKLLRKGMTKQEVVALFGKPKTIDSSYEYTLYWKYTGRVCADSYLCTVGFSTSSGTVSTQYMIDGKYLDVTDW